MPLYLALLHLTLVHLGLEFLDLAVLLLDDLRELLHFVLLLREGLPILADLLLELLLEAAHQSV